MASGTDGAAEVDFFKLRRAVADLSGREGVLAASGDDARRFLQGLVTNDMSRLDGQHAAMYCAFLTPQGRVLVDGFIAQRDDAFLVQAKQSVVALLQRHLKMYRLRAKVQIDEASEETRVFAVMTTGDVDECCAQLREKNPAATVFVDPRTPALGVRVLLPASEKLNVMDEFERVPASVYEALRLLHGVPEGPQDMPPQKAFPLESNLDWLNGVAFDKGCYLGQELTARTHFQGAIRKRLMPVHLDVLSEAQRANLESPTPEPGLPVVRVDSATTASAAADAVAEAAAADADSLFPHPFFAPDFDASAHLKLNDGDDVDRAVDGGGDGDHGNAAPPSIVMGGRKVGKLLSTQANLGMAQIRLRAAADPKLAFVVDGTDLVAYPYVPSWWPES
eukprot:TRINITY_DN55776_c0_g1_i1.p1 TRINITY_DN55776_c0_g1~~TRINITY_DN55776_c0_g1_i1.p1  ORF type:complete len:432 (-),score=160.81 TRINITY_DN55776_c0_g1_i1:59-1234(-)